MSFQKIALQQNERAIAIGAKPVAQKPVLQKLMPNVLDLLCCLSYPTGLLLIVTFEQERRGGVAQLVRASACHAEGRRFESGHPRHYTFWLQ
jgi:hypothetical protein